MTSRMRSQSFDDLGARRAPAPARSAPPAPSRSLRRRARSTALRASPTWLAPPGQRAVRSRLAAGAGLHAADATRGRRRRAGRRLRHVQLHRLRRRAPPRCFGLARRLSAAALPSCSRLSAPSLPALASLALLLAVASAAFGCCALGLPRQLDCGRVGCRARSPLPTAGRVRGSGCRRAGRRRAARPSRQRSSPGAAGCMAICGAGRRCRRSSSTLARGARVRPHRGHSGERRCRRASRTASIDLAPSLPSASLTVDLQCALCVRAVEAIAACDACGASAARDVAPPPAALPLRARAGAVQRRRCVPSVPA